LEFEHVVHLFSPGCLIRLHDSSGTGRCRPARGGTWVLPGS
jgi:hypothetical protein